MDIFGSHVFGSCAEQWLKLCKEQKKAWILKNTAQTNDALISEFINNPNISKECKCLDCGKTKKDESNRVSKEVATISEQSDSRELSRKDSPKRQPKAKGGKG